MKDMPDMPASHEAMSAALIADIVNQSESEARAIIQAAEAEARDIVVNAFATARRRAHQSILELRREGERRLRRAAAQRETDLRMAEEARASALLRRGCPLLIDAVIARWNAPESRRIWIETVVGEVRRRLKPGSWTVEHPAGFSGDEQHWLAEALTRDGEGAKAGAVAFVEADDFVAGLRIRSEGALLDATPEALLGDRAVVEAEILAAICPHPAVPAALAETDNSTAGGGRE